MLIAALALIWRLAALKHEFTHPDEVIAVSVVGRLADERTLDTNWARTGVKGDFRYDQYNFSTYHLFSGALETARHFVAGERTPRTALLERLRRNSTVLGVLAIILCGWLGFRIHGTTAGLIGAMLTGVCVTLFQDALYARPEAFTTVLTLGLVLVATSERAGSTAFMALTGVLLGLLIATKITFLAFVPFPLMALAARHAGPHAVLGAGAYFGCLGLGFGAGAPWAVTRPWEYLAGVSHLLEQYANGHWPHGVHDGPLLARIQHALGYLFHVIGLPALLAAIIGAASLGSKAPLPVTLILGGVLATMAYFLQTKAFFERNLSHALPLVFILAGVGIATTARLLLRNRPLMAIASVLLALAIAIPGYAVTHQLTSVALPRTTREAQARIEANLSGEGYALVDSGHDYVIPEQVARRYCGRIAFRVVDYGDRYTRRRLEEMLTDGGMTSLARIPGPFHGMPASTLQTYHAADLWYLASHSPSSRGCEMTFEPLRWTAATRFIDTEPSLAGAAVLDGHHPGALAPDWRGSLYGTWAGRDSNTGRIVFDGVEACDDVVLPVVAGPRMEGVWLRIEVDDSSGHHLLHDGSIPTFVSGWAALRLVVPRGKCWRFRIALEDEGTGWGQWGGIGKPGSWAGASRFVPIN